MTSFSLTTPYRTKKRKQLVGPGNAIAIRSRGVGSVNNLLGKLGPDMTVVIQQEQEAIEIPDWVRDLNSFRKWAKSDDFPQRGWYAHLNGKIWVDLSMEKLALRRLAGP